MRYTASGVRLRHAAHEVGIDHSTFQPEPATQPVRWHQHPAGLHHGPQTSAMTQVTTEGAEAIVGRILSP